jgi:hypothetical protein
MPLDSSEQDDDPEIEFSEIDPTGRYGRVCVCSKSLYLTLNSDPSFMHSLFELLSIVKYFIDLIQH